MSMKKVFAIGCRSVVILIIAGFTFLGWAMSCLFYEDRRPNGGDITVVYVPKDSRAYINKSSH